MVKCLLYCTQFGPITISHMKRRSRCILKPFRLLCLLLNELAVILLTAIILLVLSPQGSPAADLRIARAILELDPDDSETLDPQRVVKECSTILADAASLSDSLRIKLYLRRANALLALDNRKDARKDYEVVLRYRAGDPDIRCLIASTHKDSEIALKAILEVIHENPKNGKAYVSAALEYGKQGNNALSLEYTSKAIQIDNRLAEAYFVRAVTYSLKGDWESCLSDVSRYITLRPYSSFPNGEDPYVLKGNALYELDRPKEALQLFMLASRLNPSSFEATYGIWQCYFVLCKYHAAFQVTDKLLLLDTKRAESNSARIASLAQTGKIRAAITFGEDVANRLEKDKESLYWLAMAYSYDGKFSLSLESLNNVLALDKLHKASLYQKAILLAMCPDDRIRNGQKAKEICGQLSKMSASKDADVTMALAAACAECQEFEEAVKLAKTVFALELKGRYKIAQEDRLKVWTKQLKSYESKKPVRLELSNVKELSEQINDN